MVFWIGLILLSLASVGLFGILWMFAIWNEYVDRFNIIKYYVPFIVGGFVFVFIGFFMMRSGVKKPSET